ncbi:DUF7112 family protein [Natrarchaeobius oligotrophus]|uniref:Uncharacterized protein n=1 Tax=Natrarchaeobius chitinivorans TaxID=1679083 RepID=A0A3N6N5Z8_NATCH|nr:hypothetical protein [Natrarchaeobius chitinivorans]RQH03317.1 hypothetical protein EA472_01680 [Natrarchaeobius chitinivorans]
MADRVSSDHPSVRTVRATCTETSTDSALEIPADESDAIPVEEVVRFVLDGEECFGRATRSLGNDGLTVYGVYETPDAARDPGSAPNRLTDWIDAEDVRTGGSILVDVVEPDFLYGLRTPGETAYYDAYEPPSESLSEIARSLEDR